MAEEFIDAQLVSLFFEEAKERTSEIENGLLKFEKTVLEAERHEIVLNLMRVAHSLKGASGFVEMREVEKACHWMEDIFEAVSKDKIEFTSETLDLVLKVNDAVHQMAQTSSSNEPDQSIVKVALDGALSSAPKRKFRTPKTRAIPVDIKTQAQPPPSVALSLPSGAPLVSSDGNESIRISLSKIDALLYRSEELLKSRERLLKRSEEGLELYDLIMENRVSPSRELGDRIAFLVTSLSDKLVEDYRTFETATFYLESEVRRARMQSFKDACTGLNRVVRDACAKSGKQAELTIDSDNVEIDQSIVQGMNDVLRHFVRNAIDHGIESEEDRVAAGKPIVGNIKIIARTTGDRLNVQVEDDGRGVLLLREMQSKRLANQEVNEFEERSMLQELFRPGYTTAAAVTKLSGRGVGLDIVKKTVERLRGYLEVSLNEMGGTTFSIVLPLSLTVTRGLMINIEGQHFAIETATARRMERILPSSILRDGRKTMMTYQGRQVPALLLTDWLHNRFTDLPAAGEFDAVMIGEDDNQIAVIVDKVHGEQELVVRPLGPRISGNRKYNGAATLVNGDMVLVLNPVALFDGALGVTDKRSAAKQTVLVVDDSPTVRNAHKRHLEQHGFAVHLTTNGAEAWDYLQQRIPDILIADVDMPVMDGLTLAENVRAFDRTQKLPVILVTSRTSKEDRRRSEKAKVSAYVIKHSCSHDDLAETAKQILAQASRPEKSRQKKGRASSSPKPE